MCKRCSELEKEIKEQRRILDDAHKKNVSELVEYYSKRISELESKIKVEPK